LETAKYPVGQAQVAVLIEDADVTGVQPAVAECLGRRPGLVQVALHDVGSLDDHLAALCGSLDPAGELGVRQVELLVAGVRRRLLPRKVSKRHHYRFTRRDLEHKAKACRSSLLRPPQTP
jgi:hypothetical protein